MLGIWFKFSHVDLKNCQFTFVKLSTLNEEYFSETRLVLIGSKAADPENNPFPREYLIYNSENFPKNWKNVSLCSRMSVFNHQEIHSHRRSRTVSTVSAYFEIVQDV